MNIESPNYHQTFSLGTIWKFAEVLGIDIRELFTPIEEDKNKKRMKLCFI